MLSKIVGALPLITESKKLKETQLVHCSLAETQTVCECSVFRGLQLAALSSPSSLQLSCVHVRLLKEIVQKVRIEFFIINILQTSKFFQVIPDIPAHEDHEYALPSSNHHQWMDRSPLHRKVGENLHLSAESVAAVGKDSYSVVPDNHSIEPRFGSISFILNGMKDYMYNTL